MLPKFKKSGNLPKGIHRARFDEIRDVFGSNSARRKWLIVQLEKIIELAKSTGKLERVIMWGSFVSDKEFPGDLDFLLIMSADFDLGKLDPEVKRVFNYFEARIAFNADVFWTKSSIGYEIINMWLETYQMTRDFKPCGIVEVIIND